MILRGPNGMARSSPTFSHEGAPLTFNSLQYAAFLPIVVLMYWRLRRDAQNVLLLVASYIFYGLWNWRFCGLLAITTLTDYSVGRLLDATEDPTSRRRLFMVSIAMNLGILGLFKYFNFFLSSAHGLLRLLAVNIPEPTLRILLPIGISFYTFHGISYTCDVYRRRLPATTSLLSFAVFVAFFPQLVAGPIGRAHLQLPQFERDRHFPRGRDLSEALFLILLGLFRKVAIADAVAPYANQAFSSSRSGSSVSLLIGLYAFAFQIYGDFAGYSDIARGSARLLGIELPVNFNQPYLARSITDFWRRWHISLSTWLRDYLYIPLGGNRGSRLATYRNLMLTMLIGGLWHGAAATFLVWGGLHGLLLAAERLRNPKHRPDDDPQFTRHPLLATAVTFHLVCFTWVFFRAGSLAQAVAYLGGILTFRPGPIGKEAMTVVLPLALLSFAIDFVQRRTGDHAAALRWTPAGRGAVYALLLLGVIVFSGTPPVRFFYFQF